MTCVEKDLKVSFITRDTRDTEEQSSTTFNVQQKATSEILDNDSKLTNIPEEDEHVTWKAICAYAPTYYLQSIPFMFNRMNPYLLNMISLIFVAFYGSATLTAGFGLGNAIFMFFWQTFTQVNGETQGISCSKTFGAGDYKGMRLGFYRGLIWNYVVTFASAILYYYMDKVLLAAGFEAEMTKQAHYMVVSLIPALFLQTINEMIRNYLMSQRVAKPFIWINLVSFAFFPIGGYYIIYNSGWGIAGFGLLKFIVETINFIGLLILQKKYAHPESIKRESLKDILNPKDCKQYMKDFGKILMGWYASYFGLEVNTILCGLMADTVIMACWVSYMNCFAIVWTIGAGLAISTRTACGIRLGENKPLMARKYAFMGFILAFGYSILGAILIIGFHVQISEMFTEVPEVLAELKWLIILMGICTVFAGSGATGATMFRVINKAGYYSILMLANQVVISTTLSALGLFYWGCRAGGPAYGFITSWVLTFFFTGIYMKRLDWRNIMIPAK